MGPQIPKIANLLVLPVITQFLSPTDYGIYGTLLAYTGLLAGLRMMGFDVLLINSFFKKSAWKNYWKRYLGGLYAYNFAFAWVYGFLLYTFMPKEVGENTFIVLALIIIPSTFFSVINKFGGRYFQLKQKPQYIAIVTIIVGSITVLMNLYTIAYLKLGYMGWFISTAIGESISFICYSIPIVKNLGIRPKITLNRNFWKKSIRVALPTVPHNYSTYLLNSSDRLVMDQLKTPIDQIGIYNLAYIFGGYMEFFGNAVGMAVGPIIAGLFNKKTKQAENQIKSLIFFLQTTFLAICFVVSLWVKELFNLLIRNDNLSIAYPLSIIIIMGYAYRPLYWASVNKLMFYEHTNKLWRISFIAGLINVGLNLIFIPIYGIYAAAITTLISLIYLGLSPYFIKEYQAMQNAKIYPVIWMILIVIFTGIAFYLKDINPGIKVICSLLVIAVLFMAFKREKRTLSQIVS